MPRGLGCLSIMFCRITPVCLTLLASVGWIDAPTPGLRGVRGTNAGLKGLEATAASGLGNLTSPGPVTGGGREGDSLGGTGSFSATGRITLPNPGRGDFGDPLSRLLVSEVLALLNRALRALTSMLSSIFIFSDDSVVGKVLHVQQ